MFQAGGTRFVVSQSSVGEIEWPALDADICSAAPDLATLREQKVTVCYRKFLVAYRRFVDVRRYHRKEEGKSQSKGNFYESNSHPDYTRAARFGSRAIYCCDSARRYLQLDQSSVRHRSEERRVGKECRSRWA